MKKLSALCAVAVLSGMGWNSSYAQGVSDRPLIESIRSEEGALVVSASVPVGYRSVVLRAGGTVDQPIDYALAAGELNGHRSTVTFTVPDPGGQTFLRLEALGTATVPDAEHSGAEHYSLEEFPAATQELTPDEMVDHVLNRIAYGPTASDKDLIEAIGLETYINRQLNPEPEDGNLRMQSLERDLIEDFQPFEQEALIVPGDEWRYRKGTRAVSSRWRTLEYDDSGWELGPSGIGYGDDDDATVLDDMRQTDDNPGYVSVFMRKEFTVNDLDTFDEVALDIFYDDGFVAYINGTEVARANMREQFPRYDDLASATVDDYPERFQGSVGNVSELLLPGTNLLAIQLHNTSPTSSDASMIPTLYVRRATTDQVFPRIKGFDELQQLVHIRGVLAQNQLQTVLAEFWENHFTTDFDKVSEYLDDLRNSDEELAMDDDQAEFEAANIELEEYQFFYDHALGNFGDLLLYSATSPTQLIYLDNVLNKVGEPNENYSREILELFAFGVDNRYTQEDIEELSKAFTGWQVRKIRHDQRLSFPDSARQPPTTESVAVVENVLLNTGPGWRYFKGVEEPSAVDGQASTQWTENDFDDSDWLNGATSIGYGDGDDETVLRDMRRQGNRRGYASIYLRRKFTIDAPDVEGLLFSIDYDDGYVAYLNGVEFSRSQNMEGRGEPPRYSRTATANHEAGGDPDYVSMAEVQHLLRPSPEVNVLAVQVHNVEVTSSDLSVHPRIIERMHAPGSIENGDLNGFWTFRFNPEDHDFESKILFEGTPHEMRIPGNRSGIDGLRDAVDVIDSMVGHPSTAEFISIKLMNRFVSDEISLASYHDRTAPAPLLGLADAMIESWFSTSPPGNIRTVMGTVLDTERPGNPFWSQLAYRAKVKTPVEFINSTMRALDWNFDPEELPDAIEEMGMHFFDRDEPDGWSEFGFDWISTGGLLERLNFVERVARYNEDEYLVDWDVGDFLRARRLETAEDIIGYFDGLLLNGKMSENTRELLLDYSRTNSNEFAVPFVRTRGDYERRAGELIGLILAMPENQYQ